MVNKLRRGKRGIAAQYLTRAGALRKIQSSLADFRRLCILKGVYPRDPKKKLKGKEKIYHNKDINYLLHEPLLEKFRELHIHKKRVNKALGKREYFKAKHILKQKPIYTLYPILKQRYPAFLDAIKDLDDALSTVALFASLPSNVDREISADTISESITIFDQFMLYICKKRLLRKVFCSIKGYYIHIQCLNQFITFLIPHQYPQQLPYEVDFKVMLTFLEFYLSLLKAVNFKLYSLSGFSYPPILVDPTNRYGCRFLSLQISDLEKNNGIPTKDDSLHKKETITDNKDALETNENVTNIIKKKRFLNISTNEDDTTIEKAKKKQKKNLDSVSETIASSKQAYNTDVDNTESLSLYNKTVDSKTIINDEFYEQKAVPASTILDSFNQSTTIDEELIENLEKVSPNDQLVQTLFDNLIVFISREVPLIPLAICLKSCGVKEIGWEGETSPLKEFDSTITHHIVDRNLEDRLKQYETSREFIQPQWVFDSINSAKRLPIQLYKPSAILPPHLSPFINEKIESETGVVIVKDDPLKTISSNFDQEDTNQKDEHEEDFDLVAAQEKSYFEELQQEMNEYKKDSSDKMESKNSSITTKTIISELKKRKRQEQLDEEYQRKKALLSKKHKRLLERIEYGRSPQKRKIIKT